MAKKPRAPAASAVDVNKALAEFDHVRSTSYGSTFGAHVEPDFVFKWTDTQDAIHVRAFDPHGRKTMEINYTREAAEKLTTVLALALGWPSIPGER